MLSFVHVQLMFCSGFVRVLLELSTCFCVCSTHVLIMFCSGSVHVLFMFCACCVHVLFMFSSRYVHVLFVYCACSVHVLSMFPFAPSTLSMMPSKANDTSHVTSTWSSIASMACGRSVRSCLSRRENKTARGHGHGHAHGQEHVHTRLAFTRGGTGIVQTFSPLSRRKIGTSLRGCNVCNRIQKTHDIAQQQ